MNDYTLDDVIFLPFTTRAFATGVPTVLTGSQTVEIYENASITPIVEGAGKLVLTISLNSIVGFNMVTATLSAANGFETGKHYTLIIKTGTVGGVSVVGEVVGEFTIGWSAAAVDLANATDGLGALKAETALIVADTNELQTDDVPGLIATLDAVVDTVKAETVLILADTSDMQPRVAAIEVDTGTTLDAALAVVDSNVDAILVDTGTTLDARIPAALTAAGNMKSDILAVDGDVDAADRLQKVAQGNVFCTVGAASTTTSIVTSAMDPAAAVTDQFKGRIVTFKNDTTTANLRGQSTDITASTALGVLTVTALTTAPVSGDTFTVS